MGGLTATDTHALLWYFGERDRLGVVARRAVDTADRCSSLAAAPIAMAMAVR